MGNQPNVPDLRPWEHDLRCKFVVSFVDVEPQVCDAQPEVALLLVEDLEVVDAVHVEVLGNLQVLDLRLVPRHASVVSVPEKKL